MDKSSTFLALLSIISILAITSIAITDIDSAPVRQPFPASEASESVGANTMQESEEIKAKIAEETSNTAEPEVIKNELDATEAVDFRSLDFSTEDNFGEIITAEQREAPYKFENTAVNTIDDKFNEDSVFTTERLRQAGIARPIIQPKPFNGVLFDELEIETLTSFDITQLKILNKDGGNEVKILDVYVLDMIGEEMASEIYDLIKVKFKALLGVDVNETNDYGMKSFYINYTPSKTNVFLVVKFEESVYALSYPRDDELGVNMHDIVKNLL